MNTITKADALLACDQLKELIEHPDTDDDSYIRAQVRDRVRELFDVLGDRAALRALREHKSPSDVLSEFCADVEAAGGIYVDADGRPLGGPVADPAWADLAVTYVHACEVLGRKPKVAESP